MAIGESDSLRQSYSIVSLSFRKNGRRLGVFYSNNWQKKQEMNSTFITDLMANAKRKAG